MNRVCVAVLLYAAALAASFGECAAQVYRGPEEPTTCPSPFRPAEGKTYRSWYAFDVTWYTSPHQVGAATYVGYPTPVVSDDGSAIWERPSVLAQCTLIWWYNINGTVAYVDFHWRAVEYGGNVVPKSDGCDGGGGGGYLGRDPIYMESFDPYSPDPDGELAVQDCTGGGGTGGSGGTGDGGGQAHCYSEWMELEISYDGGKTWQPFWSGWGRVCTDEQT